jgi:hypothetical protein
MKSSLRRYVQYLSGFLVFCAGVSLAWVLADTPSSSAAEGKGAPTSLDRSDPRIRAAIALQDRHTPGLMKVPDVVGTATGLTEHGQPAILVFVRRDVPSSAIPSSLDGVPVVVETTGEFRALAPPAGKGPGGDGGGGKVDPTATFPRPVPIGVSTGSEKSCSAGTIGARVKRTVGGVEQVLALSNNHVYAEENAAPLGSRVLQPGRYDTNCAIDAGNVIGTLDAYVAIVFSTSANNVIDAAVALSHTNQLGNATPSNGYGTPKSATVTPALLAAVQKYGRTSSLTKGRITGINATVNIGYSSGTARFVDQIVVDGRGFIRSGDSGSLLVTDPGRNPVGLLYAGTASGKTAIANRIDLVLGALGVTIDGE